MQKFERPFFDEANHGLNHELLFHSEALHKDTAAIADGCPAICAFVNDQSDPITLSRLAHGGAFLISLRAAGYNNVNLDAAAKQGISVMRVPAYALAANAEHAVALNRHLHKAYNRVRQGNFGLNIAVKR